MVLLHFSLVVEGFTYNKYSIAVYSNKQDSFMTRYATSDLSRKSGDIIAEALRSPVTITQRNKPRLVLLSIEDYRRLTAGADTCVVGMLATLADKNFAGVSRGAMPMRRKARNGERRRASHGHGYSLSLSRGAPSGAR